MRAFNPSDEIRKRYPCARAAMLSSLSNNRYGILLDLSEWTSSRPEMPAPEIRTGFEEDIAACAFEVILFSIHDLFRVVDVKNLTWEQLDRGSNIREVFSIR